MAYPSVPFIAISRQVYFCCELRGFAWEWRIEKRYYKKELYSCPHHCFETDKAVAAREVAGAGQRSCLGTGWDLLAEAAQGESNRRARGQQLGRQQIVSANKGSVVVCSQFMNSMKLVIP